MVNTILTIQNENSIIQIEGPATIDSAVQIHKIFIEALENHLTVNLDISKVTDCDCSFIQLMSSLCYSLYQSGKILILDQNDLPKVVIESIKTIGYCSRCNCTRVANLECPLHSSLKNSELEMKSSI